MPYTFNLVQARTSAAASSITASITLTAADSVLVVMFETAGATDRAGGALTWGAQTLTQANSTQKAAASPEVGVEMWYLLNPGAGTNTLTIPDTGILQIRYTVVTGRAAAGGGGATFLGANGSNNTSTNPACGAIQLADGNAILFAVVGSGATTWAPSARTGTQIADTDDGAFGGGEQYLINNTPGSVNMSWTFATSDDWGAVAAAFGQVNPPQQFNNYMSVNVGDGMGTGERIR